MEKQRIVPIQLSIYRIVPFLRDIITRFSNDKPRIFLDLTLTLFVSRLGENITEESEDVDLSPSISFNLFDVIVNIRINRKHFITTVITKIGVLAQKLVYI